MGEAAQDHQGPDERGHLGVVGAVVVERAAQRTGDRVALRAAFPDFVQRLGEALGEIVAGAQRLAELLQSETVLAKRAALLAREAEGSDARRDALPDGDVLRRRNGESGFHGRKSSGLPR